jgi:hypothetical protein
VRFLKNLVSVLLANGFWTKGICNTNILFSKYFSQNGKKIPPREKKKKEKTF